MVSQAVSTQVRAEDIVGLRTLVSQVILEERDKIVPVSILQDVEEIKRSPVGAVIRMEEGILHLKEDVAELKRGMALMASKEDVAELKRTMATKEELHSLQQVMEARFGEVEARFGQVDERVAGLQQVMEARFGEVEARFGEMDKRFRQINVRINSTFGILVTLIIAILIKLFLG